MGCLFRNRPFATALNENELFAFHARTTHFTPTHYFTGCWAFWRTISRSDWIRDIKTDASGIDLYISLGGTSTCARSTVREMLIREMHSIDW